MKKELKPEYMRKYAKNNKQRIRAVRLLNPAVWMLKNAKKHASINGMEFSITQDDLPVPSRCPILGLDLRMGDSFLSSRSPTLLRVDLDKGFVSGNCIVVSRRAAMIRRNRTLAEHIASLNNKEKTYVERYRGVLEDHIKLVDWLKNASSQSELEMTD